MDDDPKALIPSTTMSQAPSENAPAPPRRAFWTLVLAFWLLYLGAAAVICSTKAAGRFDALFGADPPRVQADLAGSGRWFGMRTDVHPLFPLMFNPAGRALRLVLDLGTDLALRNASVRTALEKRAGGKTFAQTLEAMRSLAAATLMNTFAGALTVGLLWRLFRKLKMPPADSLAFAVLYGVCASPVFWGAVAETHTFSALFLVFMLIRLAGESLRGRRSLVIGVGSFGINASNLALHLIAVFFGSSRDRPPLRRIGGAALAGIVILAIAAGLSWAQRVIYRQTEFFFAPSNVAKESAYFASSGQDSGLRRVAVVGVHQGLFDFAAPKIYVTQQVEVTNLPKIAFRDEACPCTYRPVGLVAAVAWLGLVVFSLFGVPAVCRQSPKPAWTLILGVAFNFALFCVYGRLDEQFLYAPNCVLFVLVLVAVCASAVVRDAPPRVRRLYLAGVFVTAALIAVNTILFLTEVRAVYQ
jgi:hypothetical protein